MAVIANIADYDWVDFANGTLPTGNFNGGIMPLVNPPYALKAEDKAFLWEALCERWMAFKGSTLDGVDRSSIFGSPIIRYLDKRLVGSEMDYTRGKLAVELGKGVPPVGNGYLNSLSITETVYETDYDGRDWSNKLIAYIDDFRTAHGGTWNPTTPANSFVTGAKVESAPILSMYSDLENLEYPVFSYGFNPESTFVLRNGTSPVVSTTSLNIGYQMYSASGDGYWLWLPNADTGGSNTLMTCPTKYVKNPNLWMLYRALNMTTANGNTTYKYGYGLVSLSAHFGLRGGGASDWYVVKHSGTCRTFVNDIATALGWTLYPYDNQVGVTDQIVTIDHGSQMFLVGEIADGRTKWW